MSNAREHPVSVSTSAGRHIPARARVCACMRACVRVCVCVHACACIYKPTPTDTRVSKSMFLQQSQPRPTSTEAPESVLKRCVREWLWGCPCCACSPVPPPALAWRCRERRRGCCGWCACSSCVCVCVRVCALNKRMIKRVQGAWRVRQNPRQCAQQACWHALNHV